MQPWTNKQVVFDFSGRIFLKYIFSVHLQLSACPTTHFTCQDGKCVGMEKRCDNIEVRFSYIHVPLFALIWYGNLENTS